MIAIGYPKNGVPQETVARAQLTELACPVADQVSGEAKANLR
jgi:hypothetical protein